MPKRDPLHFVIADVLEQGAAWWEAREDASVDPSARPDYEERTRTLTASLERLIRRLGGR